MSVLQLEDEHHSPTPATRPHQHACCALHARRWQRRRHLLDHTQASALRGRLGRHNATPLPRRHPGDTQLRLAYRSGEDDPTLDFRAAPGAYAPHALFWDRAQLLATIDLLCHIDDAARKAHKISRRDFTAWALAEWAYSNGRGRYIIVRPDTVANVLGWDEHLAYPERKVQRCRSLARAWGIYVDVVQGRMLNLDERTRQRDLGSKMRGLANESCFTLPRRLRQLLNDPEAAVRAQLLARARPLWVPRWFTPSGGWGRFTSTLLSARSSSRRSATQQEPPPAAPHQRGRARATPERDRAYKLARELCERVPWLHTEQPGRMVNLLLRFANANPAWSAADIMTAMDAHNRRLGWISLTRDRVRTRPAVLLAYYLRDLDVLNDHPRGEIPREDWPRWCGECDRSTRVVEVDDHTVRRCPTCHPSHNA